MSPNSPEFQFLKRLLETPCPSGFERPVQNVVREYAAAFADEVTTDLHGNVIAVKNPRRRCASCSPATATRSACWSQYIDDEGFLYASRSAAGTRSSLIGQRMTIWTQPARSPASSPASRSTCSTDEERKQVRQAQGPVDRHRRQGQGRGRGAGPRRRSRHARPRLSGDAKQPGQRARHGRQGRPVGRDGSPAPAEGAVDPLCALLPSPPCRKRSACAAHRPAPTASTRRSGIAVDVTHATDCPTIDKKQEGDKALGSGPVDVPRAEHEPASSSSG